ECLSHMAVGAVVAADALGERTRRNNGGPHRVSPRATLVPRSVGRPGRRVARRAESVIDCVVSLESSGNIPGCADFRERAGISLDHEKFWAGSLWNVHGLLGVSRLHPQLLCRRARLAVLDGIPLTASGAAPV